MGVTFSETEANPLVGCWVRMSNTWKVPSRDVATSLFMLMSFRSNATQQTWWGPTATIADHTVTYCSTYSFIR